MTAASKGNRFNLAFNIFLVTGMLVAVTITTIFKLQQPGVRTFMLLLAAFGSVMGVVNTVMSANGNILTFVFGFIDVLIGTIVYLDNGIMGNFALHAFYFLPMQFIGFWQWSKRGAKVRTEDGGKSSLQARRLTARQWACLTVGISIGIAALYFILLYVDGAKLAAGKITEVDKPKILLDAVVMILNIAGQVLMSLYKMLDKSLINSYFTQFCAGGVLVSIPISILFMIMQKFYVEGITGGAVKG